MAQITVHCDHCGKQFSLKIGEYNKKLKRGYKHIFCSRKCSIEFKKQKGYKICQMCGKIFHSKPSWEIKFCSFKCYNEYRRKHIISKNQFYKVNENFFENIKTEEQAYILGILLADGHINNSGITFVSKDLELLENIKRTMSSDHPIYKKSNRMGVWYVLCINRRKLAVDLLNFLNMSGGKKADRLKYPQLPSELDRHFIRGFLDGDGMVVSSSPCIKFFSLSKDFLRELDNKIRENFKIHRPNKICKIKANCYSLAYQKGRAMRLGEWLYKNASIYLKRKKEKWEEMLSFWSIKR